MDTFTLNKFGFLNIIQPDPHGRPKMTSQADRLATLKSWALLALLALFAQYPDVIFWGECDIHTTLLQRLPPAREEKLGPHDRGEKY